jgi:hypothetical protein
MRILSTALSVKFAKLPVENAIPLLPKLPSVVPIIEAAVTLPPATFLDHRIPQKEASPAGSKLISLFSPLTTSASTGIAVPMPTLPPLINESPPALNKTF